MKNNPFYIPSTVDKLNLFGVFVVLYAERLLSLPQCDVVKKIHSNGFNDEQMSLLRHIALPKTNYSDDEKSFVSSWMCDVDGDSCVDFFDVSYHSLNDVSVTNKQVHGQLWFNKFGNDLNVRQTFWATELSAFVVDGIFDVPKIANGLPFDVELSNTKAVPVNLFCVNDDVGDELMEHIKIVNICQSIHSKATRFYNLIAKITPNGKLVRHKLFHINYDETYDENFLPYYQMMIDVQNQYFLTLSET